MLFDMETLSPAERYKLLVNTVTPRPIAWTVTQDRNGTRNCAPHSFFNALGAEPALVVLGLMASPARGGEKDTARIIRETGEFTIALVCEADAEAMNLTAIDAPPGVDELELAGIATRASSKVAPPLIASSPVTMECRVWQMIDPSPQSAIVLGEVVAMHIADTFLSEDRGRLRIDTPAMKLIGRSHGTGGYVRNSDRFEMKRLAWPLADG